MFRKWMLGGLFLVVIGLVENRAGGQPEEVSTAWLDEVGESEISDEGEEASAGREVALWPVRRLADLADIFTLQVGMGLGLHANAHATRAMQVGVGGTATTRLGMNRRYLGLGSESKAEISLLPFTWEFYKRESSLGTYPSYHSSRDLPLLYQRYRDYWAVGGEVTAAVVAVRAELHPVEIPDFLLGLVGIDFLEDDRLRLEKGHNKPELSPRDDAAIRRVAIVASRVSADKAIRMSRPEGIDVYYHRYPAEKFWGKIGAAAETANDKAVCETLNDYLASKDFDIHKELIDRAEYTLAVSKGWEVVHTQELLDLFQTRSVVKTRRAQKVRRLPNYAGLAEAYDVDAILDVRVWEWGVYRDTRQPKATIRLDCEYTLLDPAENRILFGVRLESVEDEKKGLMIEEFADGQGDLLARETGEACDVVHAQFTDILVESK